MTPYTITVSFEVWREINSRRASEDITEDAVLRELLGLPKSSADDSKPSPKLAIPGGSGGLWTKGVFFPNGTKFVSDQGAHHTAEVVNGLIECRGEKFRSLSPAAKHAIGRVCNGWDFWRVQKPGEQAWTLATNLRDYNPSEGRK